MLTRGEVTHTYIPIQGPRIVHNGAVKVNVVNNIPQTWAVSRPCSYPNPNGAPLYLHTDVTGGLLRGGTVTLKPERPHLAMDPSDSETWRQPVYFTR